MITERWLGLLRGMSEMPGGDQLADVPEWDTIARESAVYARHVSVAGPGGHVYGAYRTGTFANSIGFAVSPKNKRAFGDFIRHTGEVISGSGLASAGNASGIQFVVATSTFHDTESGVGYGLYVELGSKDRPGRYVIRDTIMKLETTLEAIFYDETDKWSKLGPQEGPA